MTVEAIDRVLLGRSFRQYMRDAWRYVDPDPLIWNWHLDAYCEHLEAVSSGEIDSLLINVPPGCSKSLTVSVLWPTWEWKERPEGRWFFASYDQELSTRDSLKCRNLIQSPWYQARWGDRFKLSGDQNRKTLFENDHKGWRLATSVSGHGLGEHPDRIIYDDLLDSRKAASPVERASVVEWLKTTMSTRGAARGVRRVAIMQRLHEEDPAAHLMKEGGWVHLCLPMRFEESRRCVTGWRGKTFVDPRTTEGELLAPTQYSEAVVKKLETQLGPYATAAQLQQRPSPAEGGVIKRAWIRFWKPEKVELPPVRDDKGQEYEVYDLPRIEKHIQSWDMSFKGLMDQVRQKVQPDHVSGGVWGQAGPDCYLLDRVNAVMDFPETCAAVKNVSIKWPQAVSKLVEDKANGPAVVASLRREVGGLISVTPKGSKFQRMTAAPTQAEKDARAQSIVALFAAGNVYVPHPYLAPWVWSYIEELCSFPGGAHDDDVDMTSQALTYLQPWVWRAEDREEKLAANPPAKTVEEQETRKIHDFIKKAIKDKQKDQKRERRSPGL